jgi:hypothetical protein
MERIEQKQNSQFFWQQPQEIRDEKKKMREAQRKEREQTAVGYVQVQHTQKISK